MNLFILKILPLFLFIAQVDLSTLSIKNVIPAGSIPKMVRVSSDGQYLVNSNWNVPLTPRHLVISSQNDLVLSTYASGEIAKLSLDSIYKHIHELENKTNVSLKSTDWKSFSAGGSVRTIDLSQDGKYIYAALNTSSELAVIDYQPFKLIEKFKIANYPVGLAVSPDDKYIAVTQ